MIIYCIRHGETNSNAAGIVAGRSDESLNQKGIAQAQQLNQKLAGQHFDAIFVSPMRRTLETANIIVPECSYIIDDRLAERDLSELKNYTIDELWQIPSWNSLTELKTPEGAETFGSGLERVRDFIADLKTRFPELATKSSSSKTKIPKVSTEPKILLITHSFISRCLWSLENHITVEKDFHTFHHQNDEIRIYHF